METSTISCCVFANFLDFDGFLDTPARIGRDRLCMSVVPVIDRYLRTGLGLERLATLRGFFIYSFNPSTWQQPTAQDFPPFNEKPRMIVPWQCITVK
jgi:hypothetical protein